MIANLSSKGGTSSDDAPAWLRIFWAAVTTLVCAGLLYAGNFNAMQTAVVICGVPFSVVILLYMVSLHKDLMRKSREAQPQKLSPPPADANVSH